MQCMTCPPRLTTKDPSGEQHQAVGAVLAAATAADPVAEVASASSGAASGSSAGPHPPPPAPFPRTLDGEVALYQVSPLGYVTHRELGGSGSGIGRLTQFKNSVSMLCYRHARCSVAADRRRHSDHYMLRWLLQGTPLPRGAKHDETQA